jgi:hypothetical protein
VRGCYFEAVDALEHELGAVIPQAILHSFAHKLEVTVTTVEYFMDDVRAAAERAAAEPGEVY